MTMEFLFGKINAQLEPSFEILLKNEKVVLNKLIFPHYKENSTSNLVIFSSLNISNIETLNWIII